MPTLAVVVPGWLPMRDTTEVAIDDKTMEGLRRYADAWPGDVIAVARAAPPRSSGLTDTWYDVHQLPFRVVTSESLARACQNLDPDLVLSPLIPATSELGSWSDRIVLAAEFTPDDLTRHDARGRDALGRLRARVGGARRRREMVARAEAARAVQCNGHAAHDYFRPLTTSPLLYFDTRLTAAHVDAASETGRTAPHERPTLAFSGRLIEAKVPRHALGVYDHLTAREWTAPWLSWALGNRKRCCAGHRLPACGSSATFRLMLSGPGSSVRR